MRRQNHSVMEHSKKLISKKKGEEDNGSSCATQILNRTKEQLLSGWFSDHLFTWCWCPNLDFCLIISRYNWLSVFSSFLSSSSLYLEGSESVTRESVVSGHTSVSGTVPIARFSEEEKKVSLIKAPHYEGIGPVDESGIPIAIRTVRSSIHRAKHIYLQHTGSVRCSSVAPECLLTHFCCLDMWSGSLEGITFSCQQLLTTY